MICVTSDVFIQQMWMLSWPRRQKLCRSTGTGGTWRELTLSALCETKVKTKYTHTYAYIHTVHVHTYVHTVHTCKYVQTYLHMCTYIYIHMYSMYYIWSTPFESPGRLKQQLRSYFHSLPVCLCTAWERRWTFKCLWRASVELQGPAWKGLGWFSRGPLKPYRAVKLVITLKLLAKASWELTPTRVPIRFQAAAFLLLPLSLSVSQDPDSLKQFCQVEWPKNPSQLFFCIYKRNHDCFRPESRGCKAMLPKNKKM